MYNSIKPGQKWLDTEGKRIQAHGGSIITVGDTFYWYGENKEKTTGEDDIWHWGVRCYSSKDLYNWKDEGVIIPPDEEHKDSPLHPTAMMDRPHILYNEKTKKYVAWLKIMGDPSAFAVLEADDILGPYKMMNPRVNPCGLQAGDFDLQVDTETKKGYVFSENPHTVIYSAELNETYTDAEGSCTEHFPHQAPPETREAPAHFLRNGIHYLITSGTTGYFPNESEVSWSENWMGPYRVQGNNPHVNDTSRTSFNSQISSVFKHPFKKDLYIAIADRWRPDLPELYGDKFKTGEMEDEIQKKFHKIFDPEEEFIFTEEDAKDMKINSSISDYVWLPIRFEDSNDSELTESKNKAKIYIDWKEEWKIEDFD